MSGWICSHRVIWDHHLFRGNAARVGIWHWLLHHAAWEATRHDVNGKVITIQRGQVCASLKRIAEECGVGIQVVRTFLGKLRDERAIDMDANTGRLIVTICNYEKYQEKREPANTTENTRATREQHAKEQENTSVAKATGRADPAAVVFGQVLAWLMEATGKTERSTRTLIGGWRKRQSDAEIIEACGQAQREGALDPVAFVEGCFKRRHDRRELSVGEDLERRGIRDLEDYGGNFSRGGHHGPPPVRDAADDMPRVLPFPAQEGRPLPERDVRVGPDFDPLLALRPQRGALV